MKLDIIGSVASGKTTLAEELSKIYQVPFYEKDNIVWRRTSHGDIKRTDEDRDKLFREIIETKDWIVEGSPRKNLRESFKHCDYIILLDVNTFVRLLRVMKRWIRQRMGKQRYNTKPTFCFLCYNIKWVFEYNKERKEIMAFLTKYRTRYRRFTSVKEAKKFVEREYAKK